MFCVYVCSRVEKERRGKTESCLVLFCFVLHSYISVSLFVSFSVDNSIVIHRLRIMKDMDIVAELTSLVEKAKFGDKQVRRTCS